jgi:hypothetical protein
MVDLTFPAAFLGVIARDDRHGRQLAQSSNDWRAGTVACRQRAHSFRYARVRIGEQSRQSARRRDLTDARQPNSWARKAFFSFSPARTFRCRYIARIIMPPSILLPARRGVPRPSRLLLGSRARGRKDICAKALGVNLAHVKSPIFRRKPKNILIVAGGAKTTPKRSFCSDDAAPPVIDRTYPRIILPETPPTNGCRKGWENSVSRVTSTCVSVRG